MTTCSSEATTKKNYDPREIRIIDGETVKPSRNENTWLIGIETPERGECGFGEAKKPLRSFLAADQLSFTMELHQIKINVAELFASLRLMVSMPVYN